MAAQAQALQAVGAGAWGDALSADQGGLLWHGTDDFDGILSIDLDAFCRVQLLGTALSPLECPWHSLAGLHAKGVCAS